MFDHILDEFPDGFDDMSASRNAKSSNKKGCDTYIEAFGGGASVLFKKNPSPIEIYNDLNNNVYSLFKVLNDVKLFEKFRELCDKVYYSRKIFEEYVISLRDEKLDLLNRAYMFFVVNRISYNGAGSFSYITNYVRRGTSKSVSDFLSSVDNLEEIHARMKSVIVENKDACELIPKFDKANVLFYLDPPYHHDTRTAVRYETDMSNEKQAELISILSKIKHAKVLLSGYRCDLYDTLLKYNWTRKDFDVVTQGGNRKTRIKVESLWKNYISKSENKTPVKKKNVFDGLAS